MFSKTEGKGNESIATNNNFPAGFLLVLTIFVIRLKAQGLKLKAGCEMLDAG